MTDIAEIILAVLTAPQQSEGSPIAGLVVLFLLGALYYAWNVWRWREVAWCRKCDGKGSFQAKSPFLGRPIRRTCRCKRKGGPWRRRRFAPDDKN